MMYANGWTRTGTSCTLYRGGIAVGHVVSVEDHWHPFRITPADTLPLSKDGEQLTLDEARRRVEDAVKPHEKTQKVDDGYGGY